MMNEEGGASTHTDLNWVETLVRCGCERVDRTPASTWTGRFALCADSSATREGRVKRLVLCALMILVAVPAMATTVLYGWENGETILGMYPDGEVIATNVGAPDPVLSGLRSLKLEDASPSSTPQAYVAWISGLTDGDIVTASFYCYDTTPDVEPSGRIWGHYVNGAIDAYAGSAGGSSAYSTGIGWEQLSYSWTFDSDGGTRDGLVIEARTYSTAGVIVWIDDLMVEAPEACQIILPCETSPVEESTWGGIKALYR